jgi:hypothetical protein
MQVTGMTWEMGLPYKILSVIYSYGQLSSITHKFLRKSNRQTQEIRLCPCFPNNPKYLRAQLKLNRVKGDYEY